jgi:large subunit ribosomal protein L9
MEIILQQDVPNLGHKDDLVKVKDGYARNFLIPRNMAIIATTSAKKMHEEIKKQRAHKEEKLRQEAEAQAEKMKDISIEIQTKTSAKGKIFGSVTNIQIAEALQNKGFSIERKNIKIKEDTVKEVGKYTTKVKLYKDIEVEIPFEVKSEE